MIGIKIKNLNAAQLQKGKSSIAEKIGAGCDEKAELLMRFGEKITKLEDCLHYRNNLQCDEKEI